MLRGIYGPSGGARVAGSCLEALPAAGGVAGRLFVRMPARSSEEVENPPPTFAEMLRFLRLRAGLTQQRLGRRAGVSGAAISALEQGVRRSPYPQTLVALACALELDADESAALMQAARRPSEVVPRAKTPSGVPAPGQPRLPHALTRLVGRERELREVEQQILAARLVTLVGPGGIGKTRLALEVGMHAQGQFRDGVWFVDLSPVETPTLVPSVVAAAVGVREQAQIPLLRTLSDALSDQCLLLILDNCEHLRGACTALAERMLLTCPSLHFLATSREPLAITGEVVWRVPALGQPPTNRPITVEALLSQPASRLFIERVQAADPAFALDDRTAMPVAEIVRRLDGIPLALELAAPRVRTLGLTNLAAHLDDSLRILVGSPNAPARQQTLRATLDWSFRLLGPEERGLFARLAPFAGDWSLVDAEAVCAHAALAERDVAGCLVSLADSSMLVVAHHDASTRYSLLETMRQYAAERLTELGAVEAAHAAHCRYYLTMAERLPPMRYSITQLDWLEREGDNLRSALRWCIEREDLATGFRLAAALHGFWFVRGALSEGRAWVGQLIERAETRAAHALANRPLVAAIISLANRLAFMQGDLIEAERLANRSTVLADAAQDEASLSLTATGQAVVARGRGDLLRARQLSEDALRRSRNVGDPDLQVFSLYGLSMALIELGQFEAAATTARECLVLAEEIDHTWGLANAHRVIGLTEADVRSAHRHLNESLALSGRLGYAQGTVYALTALGRLALASRDLAQAAAHLGASLRLASELGDRLEMLRCLEALMQAYHPREGVRIAAAATALRASLGARPSDRERQQLLTWREASKRALGERSFSEQWSHGQTENLPQLVAELVVRADQPAPRHQVRPTDHGQDLTMRERQVAALVGQGLSTRAIADELVITSGTAKVHVARVLNKLNLHSRAQLAGWAVRNGLAASPN